MKHNKQSLTTMNNSFYSLSHSAYHGETKELNYLTDLQGKMTVTHIRKEQKTTEEKKVLDLFLKNSYIS